MLACQVIFAMQRKVCTRTCTDAEYTEETGAVPYCRVMRNEQARSIPDTGYMYRKVPPERPVSRERPTLILQPEKGKSYGRVQRSVYDVRILGHTWQVFVWSLCQPEGAD